MQAPSQLRPGDRVAVVSPAFAAPGFAPAVHEQAMRRIVDVFGLVPVEYPTTRRLGADARDRAADVNAAFADPSIAAIFATIGGDDQITVTPHLDRAVVRANPKPFFGYSDNTNILNWLWQQGVSGYHGGSTQVHLGAGPRVDDVHLASLRAALFHGGELELTEPGFAEDYGVDWRSPAALTETGEREPTEPWTWAGPQRVAEGRTWGGCVEVLTQLAAADRLPSVDALRGTILLLESSERLSPAGYVFDFLRGLGERGLLGAVAGIMVARPPARTHDHTPSVAARAAHRAEQRAAVLASAAAYAPDAVVCIGVPFGHTRPQWIVPYGGIIRLDGPGRHVTAVYS